MKRQDRDGRTALYLACDASHIECVCFLLFNSNGMTPLHVACENDHIDIVNLLLCHVGINVNIAKSNSWTTIYCL